MESREYTNIEEREGLENDVNVWKVRLDTSDTLDRIEHHLRGTRLVGFEDQYGRPVHKIQQLSDPLANERGINDIMGICSIRLNKEGVQGNKTTGEHNEKIADLRETLLREFVTKKSKWGMNSDTISPLIDHLTEIIDDFQSRMIDNKERESYGARSYQQTNIQRPRPRFRLNNREEAYE
jgi:uncharacterized protein YicC (UPF0701 family)